MPIQCRCRHLEDEVEVVEIGTEEEVDQHHEEAMLDLSHLSSEEDATIAVRQDILLLTVLSILKVSR